MPTAQLLLESFISLKVAKYIWRAKYPIPHRESQKNFISSYEYINTTALLK